MTSELPSGWAVARIADVADLNPRNSADDSTLAGFVPMASVPTDYRGDIRPESRTWGTIKKGYSHFRDGDVLLAKITPCFENGKAAIARGLPNGIGAGSTEYHVLRPRCGAVEPKLLLAILKTNSFLQLGEVHMTGSVGHKRVPADFVMNYEFPLPPLNEQRRIADKLDRLLAVADICKARLDAIPAILKRFRQSVLVAATAGELTEEWRNRNAGMESIPVAPYAGDRTVDQLFQIPLPKSWQLTSINALCTDSFYGPRFSTNEYTPEGIPTIRTTDMTEDGKIILKDPPRVRLPRERASDFRVRQGDLLITRTGSIGRMAVFDGHYEAIPSAYLIRFRFDKRVIPNFVFLWLTAPIGQEMLGLSATAITQPNINARSIRALPIPLPPVEEQKEIIRRVEALFQVADRLAAKLKAAQVRVEKLTQSLLAKAFCGELVPQDPDDEPAEHVLARIQDTMSREGIVGRPEMRRAKS